MQATPDANVEYRPKNLRVRLEKNSIFERNAESNWHFAPLCLLLIVLMVCLASPLRQLIIVSKEVCYLNVLMLELLFNYFMKLFI